MVRKRVEAAPMISGWADLDAKLKRRRELQAQITRMEADANGKIDAVKANLKNNVNPLQDEVKRIEKDAEDFCTFNRDQFGDKKSMKLDFGVVGWRKSPGKVKTIAKWTFQKVVKKLQQQKLSDYLRTKDPVLDKDAIKEAFRSKALSESDLKKIGLKIEEPDEFFVEQDEVKIAQMPEMELIRKAG